MGYIGQRERKLDEETGRVRCLYVLRVALFSAKAGSGSWISIVFMLGMIQLCQ
ncbi:MAG TPA: hypothetical protein PLT27_02165 [Nitrospira sp.]|nr:hypothetical protein [Nitrospira sp.]